MNYKQYKDERSFRTSLHGRIRRKFGNAYKCENKGCRSKNTKRFEWSLIHGKEYELKIENFRMLCVSCHRRYDDTKERREKISKSHRGLVNAKTRKVSQYDLMGNIIRKWDMIKDACNSLGVSPSSIINCCTGLSKSAAGFKWKYNE